MNYEGLQNQRQNIRKYLSGKKAFSTDSLLIARLKHHSPAFDYDTKLPIRRFLLNLEFRGYLRFLHIGSLSGVSLDRRSVLDVSRNLHSSCHHRSIQVEHKHPQHHELASSLTHKAESPIFRLISVKPSFMQRRWPYKKNGLACPYMVAPKLKQESSRR